MSSIGVVGRMGANLRRRRLVIVVSANPVEVARIAGVLRLVADEVRSQGALADIDPAAMSESASVIVLAPDATSVPLLVASVRRFRADDPATAIVMCLRSGSRTEHQLATLARGGLDDFVWMDDPQSAERLHREVGRRLSCALPVALVRSLLPRVEHEPASICAWCDRNAYRPLHVDNVAEWFREDRTTVSRHLRAAELRPIHKVINYARLLHVAYRLDATSSSLEVISRVLGFRSASSLTMFVKRETGGSPSELRASGALDAIRRGQHL